MELGDWLLLVAVIFGILILSGYLKDKSPQTYSVIDSTWSKISTGAYELVSGFVSQMKSPKESVEQPITEGGEVNG